jgi:hypothetical protein
MGPARWRVEHTPPRCGFRLCLRDGGGTRRGMWSEMPPRVVFGHVRGTTVVVDDVTSVDVAPTSQRGLGEILRFVALAALLFAQIFTHLCLTVVDTPPHCRCCGP